jgi:hypothetical protein
MGKKRKAPDDKNKTLTELVDKQQAVDNLEDLTFDRLKGLVIEKNPKLRLKK